MNSWTVDQVGDWLKANDFEIYIKTFTDEDIDGVALMGLHEEDILKLLSIVNENGTRKPPTLRTQRKFRTTLEEYRKQERKKMRRDSSSVHSTNEVETYSEIYTIEPTSNSLKFFTSELICLNLTKYFLKKYNVKCHIPMFNQYDTNRPLHIKLSGVRENVKNVQKDLEIFFGTIKTKIFNDENADKRVIKWSTHIYSDSVLTILQKIFSDKKKLTIWEKTNVLSGYYIVHYLSGQHRFSTSEESIIEILNNEISYAKDLVVCLPKNFDGFLRDKKEQQQQYQTMAIIYYQYSSQIEMKISFFGLKTQVNLAKKELKILINKHRMRAIGLKLDSKQREYLLDNHAHELKNIELNYKDDNVKIQIRENLIHVPQYLIPKIKQLIHSMISQTKILAFQYIQNAFIFTEKDYLSLESIARNYNCELKEIKTETKKELIILPKGKNASTSKYIIKESKQFYSSLSITRILSISNNTIEIHKSYDLTIDITVISTIADAHREQLNPDYGNGYFESDNGKKVLFIKWSLPCSQQIKSSIKKFISAVFKQIDTLCIDGVKTIAFSTTDWEKYDQRKQLVEGILYEIKSQFESEQYSDRSWKILFRFSEEQNDFFNEFSQVISALQAERDDYQQFFYPVSTTSITLKTSGNTNISKCENAINTYINTHLLTTIKLNHPFDSNLWNQHIINAYYKYCLEIFVLPKINHTNKQSLDLIGPISAVNQAKEKYQLMSEIERQRILARTQISEWDRQSNPSDFSNIILSCSLDDQILSRQLAHRLIDEGYLVSIHYPSDTEQSLKTDRTDLFIICFSSNYSKNYYCMKTMQSIKESSKKFIPILFTKSLVDRQDDWLQRMATEEWFYESFEQEIRFKLKEDLNLDYDKLIVELFQYTKPGAVGRTYPIENRIPNEEEQGEENLQQHETHSQFTSEQIREKEEVYKQQIEEILEKKKILDNELAELIQSLKIVLENPSDKDSDTDESVQSEEVVVPSHYFIEFLFSIQRWLEKTKPGPVIKDNLPPFTVTGDYNDAIFPVPLTDKTPWWMTTANLDDFDHSTPELYLTYPRLMVGSWCNYDDTHHYFQKLIDRDIQFREFKQSIRKKHDKEEDARSTTYIPHYPHFKTTFNSFIPVWDITENIEVLNEYERRKNSGKPKQVNRWSSGWNSWMDRSVQLISDLKEGNIDMKSDEIQGKIGNELKPKEQIQKRDQLDDPNNETWKRKRLSGWRRKFIQLKIQNTIEWKEFYSKQGDKH